MNKYTYIKKDLLTIAVLSVGVAALLGGLVYLDRTRGAVDQWGASFYQVLLGL